MTIVRPCRKSQASHHRPFPLTPILRNELKKEKKIKSPSLEINHFTKFCGLEIINFAKYLYLALHSFGSLKLRFDF